MKIPSLVLLPLLFLSVITPARSQATSDTLARINALIREQAFGAAAKLGAEAIAKRPNDGPTNFIYGTALIANGEASKAIPILERVANGKTSPIAGPQIPWCLRSLGEAYYQVGNYEKASEWFDRARQYPDPMQILVNTMNRYGLTTAYKEWTFIQTPHYIFHFSPKITPEQKKALISTQEANFETANQFYQVTLPKKIDFFYWSSAEEAKQTADITQMYDPPATCTVHSVVGAPMHSMPVSKILMTYALRPVNSSTMITSGLVIYFGVFDRNRLDTARDVLRSTNMKTVSIVSLWNIKTMPKMGKIHNWVGATFIERLRQKGGDEKLRELGADQTYDAAKKIYGADLDRWIAELESELNAP